jgi:hypothetical protein
MMSHVFSKSRGIEDISLAYHEIDALRGKSRIGFCVSVISAVSKCIDALSRGTASEAMRGDPAPD